MQVFILLRMQVRALKEAAFVLVSVCSVRVGLVGLLADAWPFSATPWPIEAPAGVSLGFSHFAETPLACYRLAG